MKLIIIILVFSIISTSPTYVITRTIHICKDDYVIKAWKEDRKFYLEILTTVSGKPLLKKTVIDQNLVTGLATTIYYRHLANDFKSIIKDCEEKTKTVAYDQAMSDVSEDIDSFFFAKPILYPLEFELDENHSLQVRLSNEGNYVIAELNKQNSAESKDVLYLNYSPAEQFYLVKDNIKNDFLLLSKIDSLESILRNFIKQRHKPHLYLLGTNSVDYNLLLYPNKDNSSESEIVVAGRSAEIYKGRESSPFSSSTRIYSIK